MTRILLLILISGYSLSSTSHEFRINTTQDQFQIPTRFFTCDDIQQALDRGGTVTLYPRVYTCQNPLVISKDDTWLRGQGPSTILKLDVQAKAPVLVIGQIEEIPTETRRNIVVSDLVIDGNRLNQDSEFNQTRHWLRNNGISVRRAADVLIERVTAHSARSGGLVTELTCRRITVHDFTSYNNHFDGLAGYETEDSNFTGLYLHDNLAAGLSFDIQFNKNIIGNTIFTGSGSVGIFMRDSRDNIFTNLTIRNSAQHGVFLAQVDSDTTKPSLGNSFTGLVVANSVQNGFRVNDQSCLHNSLCGAQFVNNGGAAIAEAAPNLIVQCANVSR
ncbi:MAG: right-handed parallel beta-helix repeat-containing protein [Acidobacteria bacterium]|nr:right-handed parallel beta-helix repeat-containing protein [Acidobacteriota bacterium]